jgi:hypothetical protein
MILTTLQRCQCLTVRNVLKKCLNKLKLLEFGMISSIHSSGITQEVT